MRDQVDLYESSGGTQGTTLRGMPVIVLTTLRGMPVIVLTTLGAKSGKLRKTPLMRVEHDGAYAAIASLGRSPKNPTWYGNVVAHPLVELQDGPVRPDLLARKVTDTERAVWWERTVAAFPDYAAYEKKTDRVIPVYVLEAVPAAASSS